jgi:hypothetical protein
VPDLVGEVAAEVASYLFGPGVSIFNFFKGPRFSSLHPCRGLPKPLPRYRATGPCDTEGNGGGKSNGGSKPPRTACTSNYSNNILGPGLRAWAKRVLCSRLFMTSEKPPSGLFVNRNNQRSSSSTASCTVTDPPAPPTHASYREDLLRKHRYVHSVVVDLHCKLL